MAGNAASAAAPASGPPMPQAAGLRHGDIPVLHRWHLPGHARAAVLDRVCLAGYRCGSRHRRPVRGSPHGRRARPRGTSQFGVLQRHCLVCECVPETLSYTLNLRFSITDGSMRATREAKTALANAGLYPCRAGAGLTGGSLCQSSQYTIVFKKGKKKYMTLPGVTMKGGFGSALKVPVSLPWRTGHVYCGNVTRYFFISKRFPEGRKNHQGSGGSSTFPGAILA